MAEAVQSSAMGRITAEVSLTSEHLCSLGLSAVPPNALAYCHRHGLWQYLLTAIALIGQCFSDVRACHLRLENDPETADEWLVLEVTLQDDVDSVLARCDVYTDHWVTQVPWPERDKIQLVYNIL